MKHLVRRSMPVSLLLAGVLFLPLLARTAVAEETEPDKPQWRVLPVRSQAEQEAGLIGGEAEQHPHSIVRSPSHPDVIYLAHDVGQVWRSRDNGRTWDKTLGKGMYVQGTQSIAVDPVEPDTVLAVVDAAWNYLAEDFEGLYQSADAGESWQLVLQTPSTFQRVHQENIAYAPTRVTNAAAQRWYVAFPENALFRSDDAGLSWTQVYDLDGHANVYRVHVDPENADRLYLASSEGLFVSNDGGKTLQAHGDLPAGEVTSVRIDPQDPAHLYAVVRGIGLFRSNDRGAVFAPVHEFDAMHVFVHPTQRNLLYLVGDSNSHTLISHDGGETWQRTKMEPADGLGRDTGTWKSGFDGPMSAVLPDPRDPDEAVAYTRATLWRTDDGGRTFEDSSTLWTGYAWGWFTRSVAFDRFDPERIAFFLYDVGLIITENGGEYFERRSTPWEFRRDKLIHHSGMYSGDFAPRPGSETVVGSVGMYWDTRLIRSEDAGKTWTIVDDETARNLYVAFHDEDPTVVFAGQKRSTDGGRSFQAIPALLEHNAEIIGTSAARPDTVYAINEDRNAIWRSDNRGDTWRLYVSTEWSLAPLDSKPTLLVDPSDADRIYSVDQHGDLAIYDGKAWRSLGVLKLAGGKEQRNFVRAVATDPRHPEILYAGTHATGRPCLFRSTDGGETWTDISRNHPRLGVGGLAVHPHTGDLFSGGIAGTRLLPPPYESDEAIYHRLPDDWRERAQQ